MSSLQGARGARTFGFVVMADLTVTMMGAGARRAEQARIDNEGRLVFVDTAVDRAARDLAALVARGREAVPRTALVRGETGEVVASLEAERLVPIGGARGMEARPIRLTVRLGPRAPSERTLAEQFSLTPAEAALAQGIARGLDLARIAREARVTLNTARARLKAVFGKTGTHRQAELVVLLAALA